ncbi:hypothetical protein [Micromonospora chersina]|uniref:hypothetical protein n=1 Tax=Micromonospora chersina TaxID=47854 RepID=UPI00371AA6D7
MIAIDSKTLRGARIGGGRQVHLLSVLDTTTGIVLARATVDAKSDEIRSFAPLLDVSTRLARCASWLASPRTKRSTPRTSRLSSEGRASTRWC